MVEEVPASASKLSTNSLNLPAGLSGPPKNARLTKPRCLRRCDLILATSLITLALFFICQPIFALFRWMEQTNFYSYPPLRMFVDAREYGTGTNRSDVVQPLLGLNDKFDIAVSIWQETSDVERREHLHGKNRLLVIDWANFFEKAIFSDVVFRGVRLSDTEMFTNITFTIPTEILYTGDMLRASFVILPHSPSHIDHYYNHTSWYPPQLIRPRFRSVPFPLGSPMKTPRRSADDALDSFAISTSLLEAHEIPSMCPGATRASYYKQRLKYHPHIVTRTNVRIVRETRLYNRTTYLAMHEELRRTSCGQLENLDHEDNLFLQPKDCHRWYMLNANYETLVQLAVPDSSAVGGFREESAYAPYMDVLANAAGPKDLVPVLIDREFCGVDAPDPTNRTLADAMNITYHISYSSVTPRMFLLGELQPTERVRVHHTASELERAREHDLAEVYGKLYPCCLRFQVEICSQQVWSGTGTTKTRIHAGGSRARDVTSVLASLIYSTYWATRTSTAGISIPGTLVYVVGYILDKAHLFSRPSVWAPLGKLNGVAEKASMLGFVIVRGGPSLPFLMLRAVLRVRVVSPSNGGGWGPCLGWIKATHQERMSARLDARMDWRWKCGIFGAVFLAYSALGLDERYLFPHVLPAHGIGELSDMSLFNQFTNTLKMSGLIMQLILNRRLQVFSGRYKTSVVVAIAGRVLRYAAAVPWIVGPAEVMPRLSYVAVAWDVILVIHCWQTLMYSSRIPDDKDPEEPSSNL
ncbi:hypothetical protein C8F04DRAFT_1331776 [Mycena alexandri]|uniref:Uncharacterized protein n=1 Tax=Mycena alexandri TaxID=1745969 RepID=A0AAD6T0A9_9AGAR|nr:hypothetical protein C8F04DRAFT_1331776 [Mycena alexandri]